MIALNRYADPIAFRDAGYPFLLENEAVNCYGIGLVDTLINKPKRYPNFYLATLEVQGTDQVVGAAWITPPHPLGITQIRASSIPAVVRFAHEIAPRLSGVYGPVETAELFQLAWSEQNDARIGAEMRQGIYELRKVRDLPLAEGSMRLAAETDRDRLIQWNRQFSVDCGLLVDEEAATMQADFVIEHRLRYFFEVDGMPVSMAGVSGNTPNGIRINSVYTPPLQRGQGYATTLVSKLSQSQLDSGKSCCFLFTDLGNQTSNTIYQRIGYQMVGEAVSYDFRYDGNADACATSDPGNRDSR